MVKILKDWEKTKFLYLKWLSSNKVKKIFSKKLKYEKLSLWWITNLTLKDSVINNSWYKSLYFKLNYPKKKNNRFFINFKFLKVFINFFIIIFFSMFCKFVFRKKNKKFNTENCLLSYERNISQYNNRFADRQYGNFQFIKKKNSSFLIFIIPNLEIIFNYKKKLKNFLSLPSQFAVLNSYVSIFDILKIYFFTFISLLKYKFNFKKNNHFFIDNINCADVLKESLENSFFGRIQEELIYGLALRRYLINNKCSRFFSYNEFFSFSRSFYYFAKTTNKEIKIISLNHFPYEKNNLFFSLNKNDFSKKMDFINYSPKPDIFLTQGKLYKKFLNKIFLFNKNIFSIGSLKKELIENKIYKKRKKNVTKYVNLNKKIISIFLSSNSHKNIIDQLKKINLNNFHLIIRPHPFIKNIRNKIIKEFQDKIKITVDTAKELTSKEVMKISDYIICDDSSSVLDAIVLKRNKTKILRIISNIEPPNFSKEMGIPILSSKKEIKNFLSNKKKDSQQFDKKSAIENYYFKDDLKASNRLIDLIQQGKI